MKIAFFETEAWEKDYLAKKLSDFQLEFFPEPLTKDTASQAKDADVISVFVSSVLTADVLDQLRNVRMIATRSTGFDHIDCVTCHDRKIVVCNVPHYGTHTVAEQTFALILGLSRKLILSVERTKSGDFDHRQLTGFDLFDKTIGIIGLGDIGSSVMKIAQGFGMHIVAFSHHPDEALARKLGISFLGFTELLAASDIVTLHVPYTKQNYHLINKKNIKKFKKGSLLINTARGALVETEAIVYGLEKGILAGVGLDVLEEEDAIKEERQLLNDQFLKQANMKTLYLDHVLMHRDNVIITPHNAFNSTEALHLILDITIANIRDFVQERPQNIV